MKTHFSILLAIFCLLLSVPYSPLYANGQSVEIPLTVLSTIGNGHLPEIQSVTDMQENGVNMNQLQIQLLQQIEELTLYILQQDEQIQQLQKQLNSLTH